MNDKVGFLNSLFKLGNYILDKMSLGYFSKREKERLDTEKGQLEGEKEKLLSGLEIIANDNSLDIDELKGKVPEQLHKVIDYREPLAKAEQKVRRIEEGVKEISEFDFNRTEEIDGLKGRVPEELYGIIEGYARNVMQRKETEKTLRDLRHDYSNLNEEHEILSAGIEAFMMDHYYEFIEAMNEVRELHKKMGRKDIISDVEIVKGVLCSVRAQREAVKQASVKVEKMKEYVAKAEREGIMFQAAMHTGEIKTPIVVLDGNGVIQSMSLSAEKIINPRNIGKNISDIYSRFARSITNLIPTYENGFYVENLTPDYFLDVHIKRTKEKEYIGSILVFSENKKAWWKKENKGYDSLNDVVSQALAYDKTMPIDLRKVRNLGNDDIDRLYGLSRSNFFKERIKIIVTNQTVYGKLKYGGVPEEMILYAPSDKEKPNELGFEGGIAPSTA